MRLAHSVPIRAARITVLTMTTHRFIRPERFSGVRVGEGEPRGWQGVYEKHVPQAHSFAAVRETGIFLREC